MLLSDLSRWVREDRLSLPTRLVFDAVIRVRKSRHEHKPHMVGFVEFSAVISTFPAKSVF